MKITDVTQQKNTKRYNIYIDNKFAFGLNEELIFKYNLKIGKIIDNLMIEDVLKKEQQNKANNYALNLLSRSMKTEHEIRTKMKSKEYSEEEINTTISFLKYYNYINDELYIQYFIKDKNSFSKDGINKIKTKLYQKGIDKELINSYIEEVSSDIQYDNALYLTQKKLNSLSNLDKLKQKQKIYNFLANKGYNYNTIKKVIAHFF